MKTFTVTLFCILTLLCGRGFCEEAPEFTLSEMTPPIMESFQKGELNGILRIEEGEILPFSLTVDGDVLALKGKPSEIFLQALKTVYVKIAGNAFTFSLDKASWKPFEEQFGGELGVSAGNDQEGYNFGNFYLKLRIK